jgi:DNA-binding NtrC family response regulator
MPAQTPRKTQPQSPLLNPAGASLLRVLLIDDDKRLLSLLARLLEREGCELATARSGREAMAMFEIALNAAPFHLVITDVRLPDVNGIELVRRIRAASSTLSKIPCEVIVMTAFGEIRDGVEAMKAGAFDYIIKTDGIDALLPIVQRVVERFQLQRQVEALQQRLDELDEHDAFAAVVGTSSALRLAVDMARKVAPTDVPVLVLGETGTGKEVFVQAIHNGSPRHAKPFVAVNCSAIPEHLLESELFGFRKGAFSGAMYDKIGLLQEAQDGTLLLDEIGEMPLALQAKLLRVLEEQSFLRLGDTKPTPCNVRVVAATNRDVTEEIRAGRFRADLYYRLSRFSLFLPPLRERDGDVELLAMYFLSMFARRYQKPLRGMDTAFRAALQAYSWPGNIRELRNAIERAVLLADGATLTVELLDAAIRSSTEAGTSGLSSSGFGTSEIGVRPSAEAAFNPSNAAASAPVPTPEPVPSSSLLSTQQQHERQQILRALESVEFDKNAAAKRLGISLATLYRKIQKYGL